MIKLNILAHRKPGMSLDEFSRYWRENYAPLFSSLPEVKQHVRRYVQQHVTAERLDGTDQADCDGIVETWFDDIAAARAVFGSDNYRATIIPDEEKFLDRKRGYFVFTDEVAVLA